MIQLRHVPDDLHRKLKARAALAGMSLSDYLLREIRDIAERPTIAELRARLTRRAAVRPTLSPNAPVRRLMEQFRTLRTDLKFREDGIHTTVTFERAK